MGVAGNIPDPSTNIPAIDVSGPDGEDIAMDMGNMGKDHIKGSEEGEMARPSMDIECSDAGHSSDAEVDMQTD